MSPAIRSETAILYVTCGSISLASETSCLLVTRSLMFEFTKRSTKLRTKESGLLHSSTASTTKLTVSHIEHRFWMSAIHSVIPRGLGSFFEPCICCFCHAWAASKHLSCRSKSCFSRTCSKSRKDCFAESRWSQKKWRTSEEWVKAAFKRKLIAVALFRVRSGNPKNLQTHARTVLPLPANFHEQVTIASICEDSVTYQYHRATSRPGNRLKPASH